MLSDASKKNAYDQFGHAGVDPNSMGGRGGGASFSDIFSDVFGDIFGGGGRSSVARGSDLRYTLELDLEKAVRGDAVEIRVPVLSACDECGGSGARKGTNAIPCTDCGGAGQIRVSQGFFSLQQTCPRCRGAGSIIKDPCRSCGGAAGSSDARRLSVKIPPGVDTGDRIRLIGEGEAGHNGGPPGDLYVQISVREHAIFSRDGKDLYCEVPISIADAVLGGELEVPTLGGRVKLKIPAGDANRTDVPAAWQGRLAGTRWRPWRSAVSRGRRNAGETHRRTESDVRTTSHRAASGWRSALA